MLAHSMVVIMVRGLFSRLEFPYAQFPCTDLSGLFGLVKLYTSLLLHCTIDFLQVISCLGSRVSARKVGFEGLRCVL